SPDGTRLAVAGTHLTNDSAAPLYDTQTGQKALTLQGAVPLARAAFSPKGSRLALEGGDGLIHVFDWRAGEEVLALKGSVSLSQPVFSPDGLRLATGGSDEFLHVWDAPRDVEAWRAQRRLALAEGAAAWDRLQAAEQEAAGSWSAAAFHLSR